MPDDEYPEYGQCVHKVARGQGDGELFAQNHNGVYRSGDNGQTWESIADGLPTDFGFTVLAHPRRAGVVWVVPVADAGERIPPDAQLQVQRSDDAGATWRQQASWPARPQLHVRPARRGIPGRGRPGRGLPRHPQRRRLRVGRRG